MSGAQAEGCFLARAQTGGPRQPTYSAWNFDHVAGGYHIRIRDLGISSLQGPQGHPFIGGNRTQSVPGLHRVGGAAWTHARALESVYAYIIYHISHLW